MAGFNYIAPPTCAAFQKSNAFGRLIAGPVGSGKTTSCVIELLRRSVEQTPGDDGRRYTRHAIVRQTLKQLKDTVLKDAESWLAGLSRWKVSENTLFVEFDDVFSEWIFIPLENAEDQARLLSMQLTGAFLSECIEMNLDVIGPISGRLGRYPSAAKGAPTWHGIIADTNMPPEMSPWHRFMTEPPPNWQIFIQPSGLSPEAENLNYLVQTEETAKLPLNHPKRLAQGRKYYTNFIETYGEASDWVKRYVKAEYGDDPSGLAVFRESFNSHFHIVQDTQVIPGYPLIIGQDFGRNPWSVICQMDHMGRLVVHQEVKGENMGLEKHIATNLRPALMQEKFMGMKMCMVGDPSGMAKNNVSEETSFDAARRLGFPGIPAPTNDIEPRLRAVETLLMRQVGGGPALMLNGPLTPKLCRALAGGYRFMRVKKTGAPKAIPEKNDKEGFSHVVDALQYACLAAVGQMMPWITQEIAMYHGIRKPKPKLSSQGWT